MAKKNSTRNTEFNYYYTDDAKMSVSTIADIKAGITDTNITLLDANDAIKVSGSQIILDADNNFNGSDSRYVSEPLIIDTTSIDASETYSIYGSPHKMVLDNRQQYNNCGVDSTMNILAIAAKITIKNQNKQETAFTKNLWSLGLIDDVGILGKFDDSDGGTNIDDYEAFLDYYGIESETKGDDGGISVDDLAEKIKAGSVAIVGVCAERLWQESSASTSFDHAIAVTGVVYDSSDNLAGFYIHDTGFWMTRFISVDEFKSVTLSELSGNVKKKTGVYAVITEDVKSLTNNLNATGNNLDNTITGNSGNNIIKGLGGNDTIYGKAGDDTIYGGKGNDIVYGGDGDDKIYGENGDDKLYGDDGDDYINGGAGNDTIVGGAGNDTIYGGKGNDIIYANEYYDPTTSYTLSEEGKNIIYGDAGNDTIYGGKDNDLIYGGSGNDTIYGNDGVDAIYGGDGNDTIYGGAGNDRLDGGKGNDTINGGAGNDTIICGAGNDIVQVDSNSGIDSIGSSSGSVTIKIDNELDSNLSGLAENDDNSHYIDFKGLYDSSNGFCLRNFYNIKKNSCIKAYIEDSSNDKYRISANNSKKNIKVADSKGNNLLFALNEDYGNKITTAKYNDIVYSYGGDNTFIYNGGADTYYALEGDDKYQVTKFDNASSLTIHDCDGWYNVDEASDNDTLQIKSSSSNLSLFFDIKYENGVAVISDYNDLKIIFNNYSSDFKNNVINSAGVVDISGYFGTSGESINSYTLGDGCIENIQATENNKTYSNLDISSAIDAIVSSVTSWLSTNTSYSSVLDAFNAETEPDNLSSLIACYTNQTLTYNTAGV